MQAAKSGESWGTESIIDTVRRFWGFDQLRPMQEAAIRAGLEQRDSLVVLPTGGGKSLCYQVPPVLAERVDIVVSPLISLMKDQVDGLQECGYPAAALHSGLAPAAAAETMRGIATAAYRLVFVAPERLLTPGFLQLIERLDVRAFAIDEAHCISHWGHDFRPEYRQLAALKSRFPRASVHAYTATATRRVQRDIVDQLSLVEPTVLVGGFDRPNLVYRIIPREDVRAQVLEAVRRHEGQATIVYCISRRDTESMSEYLESHGVKARHYHAGLSPEQRRRTQDAFAGERIDVVVATVAFGMGIDRSDVRCVIHAGMPKSIEHYQQETGRAGRDGLEAECVLFYSAADAMKWEMLIERSADEAEADPSVASAMKELLAHMRRYCSTLTCRHKQLVEYFGQTYERERCEACDVCLGDTEGVEDATVTAQKILSCVARVGERFGVGHVVDVLLGSETERILACRHTELSTHGLLKDTPRKALTGMVYQLVDQGLLERSADEYPVLRLNAESWKVMRGQRTVQLMRAKKEGVKKSKADATSWDGVDRGLFEALRTERRRIAEERGVPAFVVFGDATLRDLARIRPSSLEAMRGVHGIGDRKLGEWGEVFLSIVLEYCAKHGIGVDAAEGRARRGRKR